MSEGEVPGTGAVDVDVAIIGSGAAGIAAGIEALDAGASVLVFEAESDPGGAAIISGGGCLLVGTSLQARLGIRDSPALAFDDWMSLGGPTADAEWARRYVEASAREVGVWAERFGVEWTDIVQHEGNSVPRWARPRLGGFGLMRALLAAFRARGGALRTSASAERLALRAAAGGDAGRGPGRAVELDIAIRGGTIRVHATSLVVATGGFASNLELVLRHRPDLAAADIRVGSGPGATGRGHALVESIGGTMTNLDKIWCYPYGIPDPREAMPEHGVAFRRVPGNIWINRRGQRFHNEELSGGMSGAAAVLGQLPGRSWAIIDAGMTVELELANPPYQRDGRPDRSAIARFLEHSPHVATAPTLDELAQRIGVPAAALAATVASYNGAGAARRGAAADEFGRAIAGRRPIAEPPFTALEMRLLARKTLGGVRTDLRCRVVDDKGRPIAGVFAAGEVSGMAGGRINGAAALEGTMLGPSLLSGRVAGAWAAHAAGFGNGWRVAAGIGSGGDADA
ncbi:FAD-binding protein [Pseudoclavibacter endophyticus]|uniref:FAD-binding protein n=1 Tax=Pseudoclavibacter endophyticus TaxID=1778590 RepID=UPI00166ECB73|nr:FAD-binding protein [Pseudoclavibacter endophyticus]